MPRELVFILLLSILVILLVLCLYKNLVREYFSIMTYDPDNFFKQLFYNINPKDVIKNSNRDFNSEKIMYYKNSYKCNNFVDVILNE